MNVRQSVQLLVVNGAERGLDPLNIQSHSHSTEESKQCDDSDWIGPIMTANSLMRIYECIPTSKRTLLHVRPPLNYS